MRAYAMHSRVWMAWAMGLSLIFAQTTGCAGDEDGAAGAAGSIAAAGSGGSAGAAGMLATAGASATGGVSAADGGGAGDSAAGTGGSMSMRQACLIYVRARCNFRLACLGEPQSEHPCPEDE